MHVCGGVAVASTYGAPRASWETITTGLRHSCRADGMQLTRFTDYGLRVLMFLADRQGQRTTIREVSRAHRISEQHLMKVVQRLAKLGYVEARRGRGGGIRAARAPAEISVGRVIRDLEPLEPVECAARDYDGACILFPACALRGALQVAQSRYLEALDGCTLADVAPARRGGARRTAVRPAGLSGAGSARPCPRARRA